MIKIAETFKFKNFKIYNFLFWIYKSVPLKVDKRLLAYGFLKFPLLKSNEN